MMTALFTNSIGILRLLALVEGISFLVLLFVAMPIKYIGGDPSWVRSVGMAHGVLFIAFVVYTLIVAIDKKWKFWDITWKLLVASVLPFGTFYADHAILRKIQTQESTPLPD